MDVTYTNFADFLRRSGIGNISLARMRYNAYVDFQESKKQFLKESNELFIKAIQRGEIYDIGFKSPELEDTDLHCDTRGINVLKAWLEKRKERTQESYHQIKARIEKKLQTRHREIRVAMRIVTSGEIKKGKGENERKKSRDLHTEESLSNLMQQPPEELAQGCEISNTDDKSLCQLEDDFNLLSRFVGHF